MSWPWRIAAVVAIIASLPVILTLPWRIAAGLAIIAMLPAILELAPVRARWSAEVQFLPIWRIRTTNFQFLRMAAKTTTVKVEIDISDMDRNYYRTHNLTLTQGANETEERLMVRLLAFACQADERLRFGEGPEEPALGTQDTAGNPLLWIEVGETDEKRLQKVCGKARKVIVYSYASSAPGWWNQIGTRCNRDNLEVYHFQGVPTSRLSALYSQDMKLHCMIQDSQLWLTGEDETVQIDIGTLK